MAPPPPPTDLIEDTIAEILLRLPPDEPEHFFRAALVCKPWLRILCDPGFLRRYRAFHGGPPLLGLLVHGVDNLRFVSTTSVPAFPHHVDTNDSIREFRRILDCRHGRVLLHMLDTPRGHMGYSDRGYLRVWDPVTGDTHALPRPDHFSMRSFNAVLSCDAQGCNHLDCHGGPFRVTFVAAGMNAIFVSIYTSEAGAWSTLTFVSISSGASLLDMPGTVIGDEVHFALEESETVLEDEEQIALGEINTFTTVKYDWGKKCLSVNPAMKSQSELDLQVWYGNWNYHNYALMAMEDSSLGLVCLDARIYIYKWKVNTDGAAQWVRCRVIDLEKVLPRANPCDGYVSIGFAEGVGAILVNASVGLFTIELKSEQVKRIADGWNNYVSILPYMSFYTPDHGTLSSLAGLPNV